MMTGDTSRLCIVGIVKTNYKAINRERGSLAFPVGGGEGSISCHNSRKAVNECLYICCRGIVNRFVFYRRESILFKKRHPFAPRNKVPVGMNQRKRNPLDMAAPHLFYILQRQGTGGQIARIGIVFSTFYQEVVEVLVRDNSFTAYDNVPFLADTLRNAADSLRQVGDIGADMSVAACDNLSQLSVVIRDHKRQTVQLPGNPYRTPFRPFLQIGHLFGFRQREGRELMLLLLTFHVVF